MEDAGFLQETTNDLEGTSCIFSRFIVNALSRLRRATVVCSGFWHRSRWTRRRVPTLLQRFWQFFNIIRIVIVVTNRSVFSRTMCGYVVSTSVTTKTFGVILGVLPAGRDSRSGHRPARLALQSPATLLLAEQIFYTTTRRSIQSHHQPPRVHDDHLCGTSGHVTRSEDV